MSKFAYPTNGVPIAPDSVVINRYRVVWWMETDVYKKKKTKTKTQYIRYHLKMSKLDTVAAARVLQHDIALPLFVQWPATINFYVAAVAIFNSHTNIYMYDVYKSFACICVLVLHPFTVLHVSRYECEQHHVPAGACEE